MSESIFTTELWLARRREDVFAFFSDATNLQAITPEWIGFQILSPTPIKMAVGTLIDYRIKVHGIAMRWRTKITRWDPPHSFVDEQLQGPYRQWIHTHTFEDSNGGTLCHDEVRYRVPGGWLVDKLFVRRDVERIFAFRQQKLKRLLG